MLGTKPGIDKKTTGREFAIFAMLPNKTFLNGKRRGQFIKATCRKEEEGGKLMKEHKEC